jgi:phenylalanyl-tRNA synthetase beta chain
LEFQESTHPHFDVVFELMSRKKSYGYFGLIASDMLEIHSIDQEVYLADLDWDALVKGAFSKELQYQGLPKFPLMRRDFALLIDEEVTFEALKNTAQKTERKILNDIQLFDVYEGKNLPKGKKSYGISFVFQDQNKTLTDKQVDKVMEKLKQNFTREFMAELR